MTTRWVMGGMVTEFTAMTLSGTCSPHTQEGGPSLKMTTHAEACLSVGVNLIPLITATIGGWTHSAVKLEHLTTCKARDWASRQLIHQRTCSRDSLSVSRGNANLWVRGIHIHPLEINGVM